MAGECLQLKDYEVVASTAKGFEFWLRIHSFNWLENGRVDAEETDAARYLKSILHTSSMATHIRCLKEYLRAKENGKSITHRMEELVQTQVPTGSSRPPSSSSENSTSSRIIDFSELGNLIEPSHIHLPAGLHPTNTVDALNALVPLAKKPQSQHTSRAPSTSAEIVFETAKSTSPAHKQQSEATSHRIPRIESKKGTSVVHKLQQKWIKMRQSYKETKISRKQQELLTKEHFIPPRAGIATVHANLPLEDLVEFTGLIDKLGEDEDGSSSSESASDAEEEKTVGTVEWPPSPERPRKVAQYQQFQMSMDSESDEDDTSSITNSSPDGQKLPRDSDTEESAHTKRKTSKSEEDEIVDQEKGVENIEEIEEIEEIEQMEGTEDEAGRTDSHDLEKVNRIATISQLEDSNDTRILDEGNLEKPAFITVTPLVEDSDNASASDESDLEEVTQTDSDEASTPDGDNQAVPGPVVPLALGNVSTTNEQDDRADIVPTPHKSQGSSEILQVQQTPYFTNPKHEDNVTNTTDYPIVPASYHLVAETLLEANAAMANERRVSQPHSSSIPVDQTSGSSVNDKALSNPSLKRSSPEPEVGSHVSKKQKLDDASKKAVPPTEVQDLVSQIQKTASSPATQTSTTPVKRGRGRPRSRLGSETISSTPARSASRPHTPAKSPGRPHKTLHWTQKLKLELELSRTGTDTEGYRLPFLYFTCEIMTNNLHREIAIADVVITSPSRGRELSPVHSHSSKRNADEMEPDYSEYEQRRQKKFRERNPSLYVDPGTSNDIHKWREETLGLSKPTSAPTTPITARPERTPFENLFITFKQSYPEYKGTEDHLKNMASKILKRLGEGQPLHKLLWDDYILRNLTDYKPYTNDCLDRGIDPVTYDSYYDNVVTLNTYYDDAPQSQVHHPRIIDPASIGLLGVKIPAKEAATPTAVPKKPIKSYKAPNPFKLFKKK